MKDKCAICEKSLNVFNRKKLADGYICLDCTNKAKYSGDDLRTLSAIPVERTKNRIKRVEENTNTLAGFTATKKVGNFLTLDENKKQWLIPGKFGGTKKSWVFNFSDIKEFELLENGGSVGSGGLGRAVAGGILLGGVGAVVGGLSGGRSSVVNNLQVKITTKDIDRPAVYIKLISGGASFKTNSFTYKQLFKKAQDVMSTLSVIVDGEKELTADSNKTITNDRIKELREYKQLLDDGIITDSEFETKKKQLLR
jgi:hypothetical protein